MEFLGSLGIDVNLLIAQIINFGLLLWILSKFLYNPIIKEIEKNEEELKQAHEKNKELEMKEIFLEKEGKQKRAKAKKKAQEIIEEAEDIAKRIKEETLKEAKSEKEAVIKQIKSLLLEIENEKSSKK